MAAWVADDARLTKGLPVPVIRKPINLDLVATAFGTG